MAKIKLPDGSNVEVAAGTTVIDAAREISQGLARAALAASIDGRPVDLNAPIEDDCELKILTDHNPEALEVLRHSTAHLMAEAVGELYPDVRFDIGPAIEDGFYYDFDMEHRLGPEDLEKIEAKITPRTRLVVAQHTYGYPAEMDAILQIGGRHGLPIIEDSCLALGSTYKGRKTGTFGLAAFWSFQWNKPFTTGIGGMVTTSDRELAEKIARVRDAEACGPGTKETLLLSAQRVARRALLFPRTFALLESAFRWLVDRGLVVGSSATTEYKQQTGQDFFKTMGAGQGRAGLAAMRRLDANIAHRRDLAKAYDALLDACAWPRPAIPNHMDPVLVRYPVRVADKAAAVALARHRRLELGTWFDCPLHQILASLEEYDYHPGMCPNAERAARDVVNLPTHPRAGIRLARRSVELITEIGPAA